MVVPSDEDEKKDAEKPEPPHLKYLNQLKEGRNVCQLKYNALERYEKRYLFLAAERSCYLLESLFLHISKFLMK